jgi:hypothetical protein
MALRTSVDVHLSLEVGDELPIGAKKEIMFVNSGLRHDRIEAGHIVDSTVDKSVSPKDHDP